MTKAKQVAPASSKKEYEALKRLQAWDGPQRLDKILEALRQDNLFFVVPRVLRVEGVHSDMLAWLLDPEGWHGLKEGFARTFLSSVLTKCGIHASGQLTIDEVHREFSTGNGPIDILMRAHYGDVPFVFGIENKIDSPEGNKQLERYAQGLRERFKNDSLVLVFLTPDGEKPHSKPACPTAPLAYPIVADLIDSAINGASESADATAVTLARHYVAALRTHIMTKSNPEIKAICQELYNDHQEAWRAIRRRLPSACDESHSYLASKVTEHSEEALSREMAVRCPS